MTTTEINGRKYGFVEIKPPIGMAMPDAKDLYISGTLYLSRHRPRMVMNYDQLPPGEYTLIGTSQAMTEEVTAGIVEQITGRWGIHHWKDYQAKDTRQDWFDTALDSFRSLLISLGLDTSKNYCVLEIK